MPLLFVVREVPQASTGFSPFELLFGRKPWGVLDLIKENWEEGPSPSKSEIQYVMDLRAKLHTLGQLDPYGGGSPTGKGALTGEGAHTGDWDRDGARTGNWDRDGARTGDWDRAGARTRDWDRAGALTGDWDRAGALTGDWDWDRAHTEDWIPWAPPAAEELAPEALWPQSPGPDRSPQLGSWVGLPNQTDCGPDQLDPGRSMCRGLLGSRSS